VFLFSFGVKSWCVGLKVNYCLWLVFIVMILLSVLFLIILCMCIRWGLNCVYMVFMVNILVFVCDLMVMSLMLLSRLRLLVLVGVLFVC